MPSNAFCAYWVTLMLLYKACFLMQCFISWTCHIFNPFLLRSKLWSYKIATSKLYEKLMLQQRGNLFVLNRGQWTIYELFIDNPVWFEPSCIKTKVMQLEFPFLYMTYVCQLVSASLICTICWWTKLRLELIFKKLLVLWQELLMSHCSVKYH